MMALDALLGELGVAGADLDKARAYQGKYGGRLEQILVNMGSLSTDALPGFYARLIEGEILSARAAAAFEPPLGLDELPVDFLLRHGWLPYERREAHWTFATRAPLDLEVNEWLGQQSFDHSLLLVSEEAF